MVKRFTLLHGALAETFRQGTGEPSGDYVSSEDYQSLQAALREALDGWGHWYVNYPDEIDQKRIAELRKQFLE